MTTVWPKQGRYWKVMINATLIILAVIISTTPAFGDHWLELETELSLGDMEWYSDCFSEVSSYAVENCVESLYDSYTTLADAHETLHHNHTKNIRTIEHLQNEVSVWHGKYDYLLSQQGGTSIQDQVINLTERMVAVENKTAVNEGIIYKIQNIVRTIQVDIADIYLKINSVR